MIILQTERHRRYELEVQRHENGFQVSVFDQSFITPLAGNNEWRVDRRPERTPNDAQASSKFSCFTLFRSGSSGFLDLRADDRTPSWKRRSTRTRGARVLGDR